MLRSVASVGRMTVNPETKYSYLGSVLIFIMRRSRIGLTDNTWDIAMEKTNPISDHIESNTSGL